MKKNRVYPIVVTIICIATMIVPVLARASDQIASYSIKALAARGGGIAVEFSITGNGIMNKLGAESIRVYENRGTYWALVEYLKEDDPGMSDTDTFLHGGTIYCNGTAGVEYKVAVTVFSEDDAARDTRSKTTYVTPTSSRP